MRNLLLALVLLLPLIASAEDPRLANVLMAKPMENVPVDLINSQLAHIKKGYPVFNIDLPLPTFKLATRAYLKDLYRRLISEKDDDEIVAMYVHNAKGDTIYLPIDWSPSNIENRGNLYHELVHYLQYMNGLNKYVACKKVLEFQAYYASANYLIEVEKLPETHDMVQYAIDMSISEGTCPQKKR